MRLTKTAVDRLKLPHGKSEVIVFDEGLPGFGLRVRSGGKRTWVIQYRVGKRQRRATLGTTSTLSSDDARKQAKIALSKVHLGRDPQLEKDEARAPKAPEMTLGDLVDRYLPYAERKLKTSTYSGVVLHLRRHWQPLHAHEVQNLERRHVAAELGRIATNSGLYGANRSRAALSAMFAWAIGEGLADANPVVGTNKAMDEIARDRVLNDSELRHVWLCAGDGDYGVIVRLLMLLGQRREEVAAMRWSELDLEKRIWRLGCERTKNALPHDVPLLDAAIDLLAAHGQRAGRDLVFGEGAGPFQGWSRAKSALDNRLLTTRMTPWRIHDLRRTVATRMADLGVQPHVVEAVLNHVSGHKAGVAGIYNRSTYAAEKRDALTLWSKHVMALVDSRH